jgi:hypothetical protein
MPVIDEKLNLVIEVGDAFVHATPIARDTFKAFHRILAATHADIFARGRAYAMVAPAIATMTLQDIGLRQAKERGESGDGGVSVLLADIKRLSNVAVAHDGVWSCLPVDVAIQRGAFRQEEWEEVESAIVFFTCVWWMTIPRRSAIAVAQDMASAIGLSTTSLPPSEWMNSLPRSTPAEISPQEPAPRRLSIPS